MEQNNNIGNRVGNIELIHIKSFLVLSTAAAAASESNSNFNCDNNVGGGRAAIIHPEAKAAKAKNGHSSSNSVEARNNRRVGQCYKGQVSNNLLISRYINNELEEGRPVS